MYNHIESRSGLPAAICSIGISIKYGILFEAVWHIRRFTKGNRGVIVGQ